MNPFASLRMPIEREEEMDAATLPPGRYARVLADLSRINALRMIGTAPDKGGIFSFTLENAHAHDVSTILDRYGIAVRAGTHCAMPLLQRFGATSTCRASFALYNGKDDVDALVEAIEKAQSFF